MACISVGVPGYPRIVHAYGTRGERGERLAKALRDVHELLSSCDAAQLLVVSAHLFVWAFDTRRPGRSVADCVSLIDEWLELVHSHPLPSEPQP